MTEQDLAMLRRIVDGINATLESRGFETIDDKEFNLLVRFRDECERLKDAPGFHEWLVGQMFAHLGIDGRRRIVELMELNQE